MTNKCTWEFQFNFAQKLWITATIQGIPWHFLLKKYKIALAAVLGNILKALRCLLKNSHKSSGMVKTRWWYQIQRGNRFRRLLIRLSEIIFEQDVQNLDLQVKLMNFLASQCVHLKIAFPKLCPHFKTLSMFLKTGSLISHVYKSWKDDRWSSNISLIEISHQIISMFVCQIKYRYLMYFVGKKEQHKVLFLFLFLLKAQIFFLFYQKSLYIPRVGIVQSRPRLCFLLHFLIIFFSSFVISFQCSSLTIWFLKICSTFWVFVLIIAILSR